MQKLLPMSSLPLQLLPIPSQPMQLLLPAPAPLAPPPRESESIVTPLCRRSSPPEPVTIITDATVMDAQDACTPSCSGTQNGSGAMQGDMRLFCKPGETAVKPATELVVKPAAKPVAVPAAEAGMITLCMAEFQSSCNLDMTQRKRARCMLRVIGDSRANRQMRQQCREEVKLLVGKEVWEDVKRKLRRMRTEQGNSSSEDRTLKKRLRTKHDDVDRNTIQVAVLTASTAQIGPVIAAAVHNPATTVVTARAAQIQPTPTNDDIDSANNDTTNDSFNGFSRGAIAGSYGPQSYLNSPTPFPVLTPLTSTTSSPLPDSELTLVETAAAADVTQLPSLVNLVTPVVDCAPMHVSIAESPYVAESPASNNTASPQAAANYEHQPTDADCRRQCSSCKHFKPDDQFKSAKTCKVCSVRQAANYKKRKPKTVKPHTVVAGPVVERARQVNVPRTTRTDPRVGRISSIDSVLGRLVESLWKMIKVKCYNLY